MNELGLMILGLAIRATILAGFGLLAMAVLSRRGPSARAVASSTTLAMLVGLTVLAASPWPRWWSPGEGESNLADRPIVTANSETNTPGPLVPGPAAVPLESSRPSVVAFADFVRELRRELARPSVDPRGVRWQWPAWLAVGFLGVLTLAVLRLGLGIWAVRSLRTRSRPLTDAGLLAMVDLLRSELGLHRAVELRETSEVGTPATVGWLRPAVLLPKGWGDWDVAEARAVLAHELAHIARGDYLTGLAAQVSLTLHSYHPLVHALARRLRLEQELAADAWGAQLSGGRRPYLTALANLALRQAPKAEAWPTRPFLPTRGTFLRRIEMLRDPKALQHPPMPKRARAVTVASVVLAGLIVAGFRGPDSTGRLMAQEPAKPGQAPIIGDTKFNPIDPSTADSDVHLVIDIRMAGLLMNPEIKKLAGMVAANGSKEIAAILSGEIDQIVVLGFERPAGGRSNTGQPPVTIVSRSSKPYDWRTFISPPGKAQEVKADGFSYFRVGNAPAANYFRILDDRTLLMGSEADVKNPPIGGNRPKGRHSWDDAWKKLPPGPIRVALDTPWLVRQLPPMGPPGQSSPVTSLFAPLLNKAQAYGLTLGLADGLTLDALATCGTDDSAGRVADTVRASLALARNALPDVRKRAEGGPPEMARPASDLLDALDVLLETAKIEQNQSVATLKVKADPASVATAVRLLAPAVGASREAARRAQCINNQKQIMLAMHNYISATANSSFPPAVLYGPDGKTPYSWRVALLPYLEEQKLYSQYKFDEPWDGPNNSKLIPLMPAVYACPDHDEAKALHFSSYYVLEGPGTLFPNEKEGTMIAAIRDGTSNTIAIVEAKREVPWTKPEDIPYDKDKPLPTLGGVHPGGFNAGFADGAVRFLKHSIAETTFRALISRNGGEVISADSL